MRLTGVSDTSVVTLGKWCRFPGGELSLITSECLEGRLGIQGAQSGLGHPEVILLEVNR